MTGHLHPVSLKLAEIEDDVMQRAFTLVFPSLLLALSGCATAPTSAALAVRDADARMVESCQFLGDVAGTSGWGGLAADTGEQNAQTEAREKAARLGATDIVWTNIAGGWAPNTSGKAYRCGKSRT